MKKSSECKKNLYSELFFWNKKKNDEKAIKRRKKDEI